MQSLSTLKRTIVVLLLCFIINNTTAQSIVACTPPAIITQPVNSNVPCGNPADFETTASGTSLIYQWQKRIAFGFPWIDIIDGTDYNGATTAALHLISVSDVTYRQYQAVITNACGTVTSDTAVLVVQQRLLEVSPPVVYACTPNVIPLHITTVNDDGSPVGGTWSPSINLYSNISTTLPYVPGTLAYTVYLNPLQNINYQVTSIFGNCTSTTNVNVYPLYNTPYASTFIYQPHDTYICEGSDGYFSVYAYGLGLGFQWQESTTGCSGNFVDIPGATDMNYTVTGATPLMNGYAYRCRMTAPCTATIISDCATLHLTTTPFIVKQPADAFACVGSYPYFETRTGYYGDVFQWQVSTDLGATFTNIPGASSFYFQGVQATAAMDGFQYRAVISSPNCTSTTTSLPATLHINTSPGITLQPVPVTVCPNGSALFTASSNQTGVSYQWQISTDGGAVFSDLNGELNDSLIISPVTAMYNNTLFHVIISGTGCSGPTASVDVSLTLFDAPIFTTQPTAVSTCVNNTATFNAVATGTNLNYQWQVSTFPTGIFTDIPGASNASYVTDPATISMNNYQYRVIVTGSTVGSCSSTDTSASALLSVYALASPIISIQPQDATVCLGNSSVFTVAATGAIVFYQWEVSFTGCTGPYANIPGATSPTLTTPIATVTQYYRCRIWNPCSTGFIYSNCAQLTVSGAIDITAQPADQTICEGANAGFSTTVSTPGVTYQWQVSTSGSPFTDIPGETNSSLTLTMITPALSGNQYHVVITSSTCTVPVISSTATLTVNEAPEITSPATHVNICEGEVATFHSVATGAGIISYQWQLSTDFGISFTDIPGANTADYNTGPVTPDMNWYLYRVTVYGSCNPPAISIPDSLTIMTAVSITTQPANVSTCVGGNVMFGVDFTGPLSSVQWQVSTTGCSGTFVDIPGADFYNLFLDNVSASQDNYAYRCILIGICNSTTTVISDCAVLTIGSINFISQPGDASVCSGSAAVFMVQASSSGNTYQWQVSSGGGPFTDLPGATSSVLTMPSVTAAISGNIYHAVVTGSCAVVVSDNVTLTVVAMPVIIIQPENVAVCENGNTLLTISATAGSSPISYIWQVSSDGGISFSDVPGGTDANLILSAVTAVMNGYLYQVILTTSACATVNSVTVTLTVNPSPAISAASSESSVCYGTPVQLTATGAGSGGAYTWDPVGIPGSSISVLPQIDFSNPTIPYLNSYTVTGTDANGCGGTAMLTVTGNPVPTVTITSNPSNTVLSPGQTVILTAGVSPTGTYTFTWQKDNTVIPGAIAGSLTVNADEIGVYNAVATNTLGCIDTSNTINVTADSVTGRSSIYIYANPNNGRFNITYPDLQPNSRISIYNSQGNRVFTTATIQSNQVVHVDLGYVLSGIYMVLIHNSAGKRLASGSFAIQH